ncbi:MAG: hypothetical protein E7562_01160 [Ruminococcaceae bacterium]|nr:hypothetical protein [Oscillospiraceae bacterium]
MKKLLALILCVMLVFGAVPTMSIFATPTYPPYVSYVFANDFTANADGVIKYVGPIAVEDITGVKLFWARENGFRLDGYTHFAEMDGATAIAGYTISGNLLIPKGATRVIMEVSIENEAIENFVDIPLNKQNLDNDDDFSMFFISDTHINHAMNSQSNGNYAVMGKESMVQRFDMLKDLIDQKRAEGDNVVGVSIIGDVVQGAQIPDTNYWIADEYDYTYANDVLSSSNLQGAYPIWYTNGNHDITLGTNGDNSAWLNFFESKINLLNQSISNGTYPESIINSIQPIDKESGIYWYDTYIAGYHFIYLSTPYNGFQVGEEQLAWLEGLLKADAESGKPTFILGHFQTAGTVTTVTNNGKCHMNDSDAFQKILNKYPNVLYFSGHTHANFLYDPVCLMMGDNTPTYINTGCFHRIEQPETVYISEGIYCRVYDDRIEFEARHFYNYTDSTEGYWIPSASYVLTRKDSTVDMNVSISSSSDDIITGSTLTATVNGRLADLTKYDCKWYIGNFLVSNSNTYTINTVCGENNALTVPDGTVSLKVSELNNANSYAWAFADSQSKTCIPIHTAQDLAKIGIDENYPLDGNYALMADIDLSSYGNWTPIGKMTLGENGFAGLFDGNGHTINGMTVNITELPDDGSEHLSGGLFAHTIGATIRSLVMKNASVTLSNSKEYCFAGVISGDSEADTAGNSTVYSNIAVINSTVSVPSAYNVAGVGAITGGINRKYTNNRNAGAQFIDCYSNADISAANGGGQICPGGFGGYAYNTKNPIVITNCIFDGTVSGIGNSRRGGLIGKTVNPVTTVTNGYSNSDKYTETAPAEAIYPISGTKLTTEQLTAATVSSLGLSDKWVDSEYGPVLKIAEYDIVYADYIVIKTGADLAKIGVDANYPLDGKYILANDIDLSSYENWTPIGDINNTYDKTKTPAFSVFSGTFDGNGYTIKNLTINYTTGTATGQVFLGLFSATRGATVKNIVFDNANVSVTNTKNQNFIGVVAGSAETLENTPSHYSNIYITNSTVAVIKNISSASGAGSFVGTTNKRNTGIAGLVIENCYSDADITNKSTNGQSTCGGFIGYAYATNASGVQVKNSIFAGTLTTSKWKGAVIGRCNDSATTRIITNVYTTAGIVNTATDGTNISVGSNGDYNSALSVEELGFTTENWYNTPVGAKHRLILTVGDIDASGDIDAQDVLYIRQYILGTEDMIDSVCADINTDGKNNVKDLVRIKKMLAD